MKIAFVDEDPDQREAFTLYLQSCFPESAESPEVIEVEPRPTLADMRFLVEGGEYSTIILDEQLKDSGVAQYFGIELASYLRTLDKKIPIFILTSYPGTDELEEGAINVEDILNKQTIHETKRSVLGARILRRINSYLDISNEREVRFEELLRKSMEGELQELEIKELDDLGYLRSAPFEVDEILSAGQVAKLDELQAKIDKIEESLYKK